MIGLVRAELLKARRRQVTYVLLIVSLALMAAVFMLVGLGFKEADEIIQFPQMYAVIGQFAFGLGGLFAVVYAATLVGADWNWGVVRNVVARGESRSRYLLAKAIALAILLAIATLIIFAVGIVLAYVTGLLFNIPVASPFRGKGLQDLAENLVLGYPVLIQRAALGLMVAVILRSQLAGAVLGIALYLGEAIVTTVLSGLTLARNLENFFGESGFQPIGPEWYQFLPISIGGNIINNLPGGSSAASAAAGGGFQNLILKPVPFDLALIAVLIYLVASLVVATLAFNRQEIA